MKYLKYLLVGGLVLIVTSSYTTKTSGLSEGINPGNIVPEINITDEAGNQFKLSDLKGEKVILNLWASYDAKSHMQNVLLNNVLRKDGTSVKMVSVSFDQSKSAFENTIKMDGISNNLQFMIDQDCRNDIYNKYQLEKGFNSFLIDENGMILAKNLTINDLQSL